MKLEEIERWEKLLHHVTQAQSLLSVLEGDDNQTNYILQNEVKEFEKLRRWVASKTEVS